VCYNIGTEQEKSSKRKNEVKKMKTIEILAIVMAECKKVYGEQFERLSAEEKKAVIMQFICEIMAKNSYLKVCIGEAFYNELVEA
jgi:hypothetical protein